MRMPHDHLADDLNRSAGSGGEGGRMPSQIMKTETNADQAAGSTNHNPGGVVADRKESLFWPGAWLFAYSFNHEDEKKRWPAKGGKTDHPGFKTVVMSKADTDRLSAPETIYTIQL